MALVSECTGNCGSFRIMVLLKTNNQAGPKFYSRTVVGRVPSVEKRMFSETHHPVAECGSCPLQEAQAGGKRTIAHGKMHRQFPTPLVVMAVKASITSKHMVHATSCSQSYSGTSSLLLIPESFAELKKLTTISRPSVLNFDRSKPTLRFCFDATVTVLQRNTKDHSLRSVQ